MAPVTWGALEGTTPPRSRIVDRSLSSRMPSLASRGGRRAAAVGSDARAAAVGEDAPRPGCEAGGESWLAWMSRPSISRKSLLRCTRCVCVTIQDCVMSTENLKRERECECTVVQISKCVQWYKYQNDRSSYLNDIQRVQKINLPSLKRSSAKGTGRQRVRCALRILCLLFKEHYS